MVHIYILLYLTLLLNSMCIYVIYIDTYGMKLQIVAKNTNTKYYTRYRVVLIWCILVCEREGGPVAV